MLFGKKKKKVRLTYDSANVEPVLRKSICTGETTAGFQNKHTGAFTEVLLVRGPADLDEFCSMYGITEELKTIY